MSYSIETEKRMSLYDYKIDFDEALGFGTDGAVFNVVKRPKNEQNLFSFVFPYLYDYFYRVSKNNYEKTNFCIKILCPKDSLHKIIFEPREQFKSNKIYREADITTIELIKSNSIFSYFKTKVVGKILSSRNHMHGPESFKKRHDFIKFLRTIINSNLHISDLHPSNVMYDEIKERWEVVDGSVNRLNEKQNYSEHYSELMRMLLIFQFDVDKFVNKKLIKFAAKANNDYTQEFDEKLIKKANSRFKKVYEEIETKSEEEQKKISKKNLSEKRIHAIFFQQGLIVTLSIAIMACVMISIFEPAILLGVLCGYSIDVKGRLIISEKCFISLQGA